MSGREQKGPCWFQKKRRLSMKRNHLLFLAALFLVTALKYAFAQEDMSGIGWEPTMVYNPMNDVLRVMVWAPIVGLAIGFLRVLMQRTARQCLSRYG